MNIFTKRNLLVIATLLFHSFEVFSQNFDTYFEDNTLRIDYIHTGNFTYETFQVIDFVKKDLWAGPKTISIDKFDYGKHKIEIYDSASNMLIYSKGFSSLFEEWRTTKEGKKKNIKRNFEETILIPFPKNTIKIKFFSRNINNIWEEKYITIFNPKTTIINELVNLFEVVKIHYSGNPSQKLDIVVVPDGYAINDTSLMYSDFESIKSAILNCSPYKENKDKINIWAVKVISPKSGIPSKPKKNITPAGLSFNALKLDRYLMTEDIFKLHNLLTHTPYEQIIIMGNTTVYGGGGIYNYYATSSRTNYLDYVIVHELGHSLAGLADEYFTSEVTVQDFYPLTIEPWEPNITSLVNFEKKWKSMLVPNTPIPTPNNKDFEIGVYEGAGYMYKGLYRPRKTCSMKETKYNNFCPVCTKAIEDMINFYSPESNQ